MDEKKEDVDQQKEVAYYAALVNAWIQTKMDRDKLLVTLSSGGIGLLVTLLSAVKIKHYWELLLYAAAVICFLVTIMACMFIFKRNSSHIEDVLCKNATQDYVLSRLDRISSYFFILGIVFSLAIGFIAALGKMS